MNFEAHAIAHGLQIGRLCPSDRVQRCATAEKPRSRNGAFFWDGQRGWVSDWAQGGELHWFDGHSTRTFTAEDRKAWAQRKQALEARQAQSWRNASLAAAILIRSTKLQEHNYLAYKGLKNCTGLVTDDGGLVVPMRTLQTNELQGCQIIKWLPDERKYEKKMLHGMRAKCAVLRLGSKNAQEAILCEGYATGLSIDLAARLMRLNMSVLICFSDSNMVHVASMLKATNATKAFVFADNDVSGAGEKAAIKTNLPFCMSTVVGEDANDLHARAGLIELADMLMKVRMM